ncbi:hypothetical protein J2X47_001392 [Sphingomonas sp. BE270]|jgi:hypothetical protein|uniref:hypothetical protein n=1 Tax=unclassified Sphingomonas TaxID=196159 RepID=UPI0010F7F74B|nr:MULTISPECIES: hypothetical protein [unclassified Sphingomonas]MDR7257221.1 hypothetical protein [Sphingomonas sp. BE270]
MRQRSEQPSNAKAATGATRVARRTIRRRCTQSLSGIDKAGELGILSQACQDTNARISNDKLKCAFSGSICDDPGLGSAAVLHHVFLEFAQRSHQPCDQSARKAISTGSIFNVAGPLIPQHIGIRFGVVVHQREHTRYISRARAAYSGLGYALANLREEWRRLSQAGIGFWQSRCRKRQLNKRANLPGTFDHELTAPLKATLPRLPKQIVDDVKRSRKSMRRSKTQECPSMPRFGPTVGKLCRALSCSPCRWVLRNRNQVSRLPFMPSIKTAAPKKKAIVR